MADSRKVLKTLPNGYEIPYPNELTHNELLFLKDYRLARFPGMETGRPADISYEDYVEWLTDYLFPEHPDYGWRVYLLILLNATHDKSKRIKHLDNFFYEFRDAIHK